MFRKWVGDMDTKVIINLSDPEALAARDNRLTVLVRPCKYQEMFCKTTGAVGAEITVSVAFIKRTRWEEMNCDNCMIGNCALNHKNKRFPVGTVILGWETWSDVQHIGAHINVWDTWYKADNPVGDYEWKSPVTMPGTMPPIRFKRIAKTNRVCLASAVTDEEWYGMGMPCNYDTEEAWGMPVLRPAEINMVAVMHWFTHRYPKLSYDRAWVEVVTMEVVK